MSRGTHYVIISEAERTICDCHASASFPSHRINQILYIKSYSWAHSLSSPWATRIHGNMLDKIIQISTSYMITFCAMCLTIIAMKKKTLVWWCWKKFLLETSPILSAALYASHHPENEMTCKWASTQIFVILFFLKSVFPSLSKGGKSCWMYALII